MLTFLSLCAPANGQSRNDSAAMLNIPLTGSLQNPVFSPDGSELLLTRFRRGYNRGPSDLYIYNLSTGALRVLVSDESSNVNLPGSSWNARTGNIVFSSTRGAHDEIFLIASNGQPGQEMQLTNRASLQAFEPSFSPDGRWVVFESHEIDVDDGVVTTLQIGTENYIDLTAEGDVIKQPNWSPAGDSILYQRLDGGVWSIWAMRSNGSSARNISPAGGSATDAAFSANGRQIVFSFETAQTERASLYISNVRSGPAWRLTHASHYDGAPSFSPDGRWVAFESTPRNPDRSRGTKIWVISLS